MAGSVPHNQLLKEATTVLYHLLSEKSRKSIRTKKRRLQSWKQTTQTSTTTYQKLQMERESAYWTLIILW
jgi:hypothetical protein